MVYPVTHPKTLKYGYRLIILIFVAVSLRLEGGTFVARPRTFEEQEVLDKAMYVFWAKGYEATSVDDLISATGLARQSMYNTFGNKHAFYLSALGHYQEMLGARMLGTMKNAPNLKEAFRQLFDQVVADAVSEETRPGCMMVNATTELAARDPDVCRLTREAEEAKERVFAEMIREAQARGEISQTKDPEMLAQFLYNTVLGLRVRATRKPSKAELEPIVAATLSLLD